MNDKYDWEAYIMLPDEHRLFPLRSDPFKKVAIADNSGNVPENTDDGVLWLDFDWDLIITSPDNVLSIPVKRDSDGERFSTVTDMATMLYLSSTFKWSIDDQNNSTIYNAVVTKEYTVADVDVPPDVLPTVEDAEKYLDDYAPNWRTYAPNEMSYFMAMLKSKKSETEANRNDYEVEVYEEIIATIDITLMAFTVIITDRMEDQ